MLARLRVWGVCGGGAGGSCSVHSGAERPCRHAARAATLTVSERVQGHIARLGISDLCSTICGEGAKNPSLLPGLAVHWDPGSFPGTCGLCFRLCVTVERSFCLLASDQNHFRSLRPQIWR